MLSRKRTDKAKPAGRGWPFGRSRRGGAMPLNLGDQVDLSEFADPNDGPRYETLGDELRAARHDRGLTLEEVAEITRVRRAYLEAIEEMRLEALPSRPFTIGYIRAYAQALGLSADAAVERFKAEEPVLDEPLQNPIGVMDDKDPRVAILVAGAMVVIAAIMTWNIAQRAMTAAAPPPSKASDRLAEKVLAKAQAGPVEVGKPLPAPVESTTPPAYETPGLAKALGLAPVEGATTGPAVKPADDPLALQAALPPTFVAAGKVYEPSDRRLASRVLIQAVKGGDLVVRGVDGSVYFARPLSKGDAYRVPSVPGLTLDVSDPKNFQVFYDGQSRGLLPAAEVAAGKLTAAPAAPPPAIPSPAGQAPATAPAGAATAQPRPAGPPSTPKAPVVPAAKPGPAPR